MMLYNARKILSSKAWSANERESVRDVRRESEGIEDGCGIISRELLLKTSLKQFT